MLRKTLLLAALLPTIILSVPDDSMASTRHESLAPSGKSWLCTGPKKKWISGRVHLLGPVKCKIRTLKYCKRLGRYCARRNPQFVIKSVFGRAGKKAWRVAWCEGSYRPWAKNGQYRGTFQMGASEREKYGHGRTLWQQARAARKYYLVAGWGPWQCAP